MAFLCPVRMRRDKKKATNANIERNLPLPGDVAVGLGRITGSSSIETLVRVGIEKEHGLSPDSKMMVLHDFTPCVDDELEVKRGQIVNVLYRENDWVYVIGEDSRQEGFIPHSYCAPYNPQLVEMAIKKKQPRTERDGANGIDHSETVPLLATSSNDVTLNGNAAIPNGNANANMNANANVNVNVNVNKLDLLEDVSNTQAQQNLKNTVNEINVANANSVLLLHESECTSFHKEPYGRYIVLYTFIARDENDVSVERGEFITLLNRDDNDWYWIVRSDGQEGFIPSAFIYPADSVMQQTQQKLLDASGVHNKNKENINNGGAGCGGGTGTNGSMSCTNNGGNLNSLSQPVNVLNNQHQHQQQQTATQNGNNSTHIPLDDIRYGTELVMLYDYKAQAPDDLSVRRGDWIYADLNNQTVDGWLWSYAPKTRKYGFIPKAYARPPAMTSL